MIKKITILFFTIILFFQINNIFAFDYLKNIKINSNYKIDLTKEKKEYEEKYKTKIIFEWNTPWENTIYWSIYNKKFNSFWTKEINLNIYKINWQNKELIKNEKINIFVYKNILYIITSKTQEKNLKEFEKKAQELWILTQTFFISNNLFKINLKEKFLNNIPKNKYITIWWDKDFLFDILSKINTENLEEKRNFVVISSFNINILQKILSNFISNKKWINKAILIDESSKYEILKETNSIDKLEQILKNDKYNYINLNANSKINSILFISHFINNLSNKWFSSQNIYLILIIPFLLIWVITFKHIIWLTPSWILIPVSIVLLFFKIWFTISITILILLFFINFSLSKIIWKYNFHYSPKIVLITIINIIILTFFINLLISYKYIHLNINDIIFVILFILISERLINIIISKELSEYKLSLINTIIFASISYLFFSINIIRTFILAYPEIILLLIPIAFAIWRFTGLRVSEYFRFKEVIKSIEEE